MLNPSARLLRLLALLQARQFWSGAELSERLEVTGRTLRRDVERLRSLGYPVQATPGVAGGYQLGAGASLPPLLLEDDEALAITIALHTVAAGSVSGIEDAAVRAVTKLERVLPSRLLRRERALRASILTLNRAGPRASSTALSALAAACGEHQTVRFRYVGRNASAGERFVEPAGLVHTGRRWYLVAWDVHREAWRTFRVDRVDGEVAVGERFAPRAPPEGGDLRRYVSHSVSVDAYQTKARVLLHAPLAVAAERVSQATGVLEPRDERSCVLETGAESLASLAFWISFLGFDFEVLEPQELIDELRELGQRIGRSLGASASRTR